MKRLSLAMVFSLAAVALFAYDDSLPWFYDTSSHPAETVALGTVSNASGVDARAYVALARGSRTGGNAEAWGSTLQR
ncbi:MAG: hypothetical protein IJH50_05565 [Kiritimatiellae bacterium]|nr:hypothetical protein [Kiritimatiellia bacterium]